MFEIPVLTLKLILVSWITSKRQLIHNRTSLRNTWNQSYDFIVVGAGTAGCVVASRLTEHQNTTVLLLEAGGPQDPIWNDFHWLHATIIRNNPNLEWHYYAEPQNRVGLQYPDGRIEEFTGKSIGGSSSYNGMVYNRGNRIGYDNWVKQYGALGWSYDEVLPYFIRSENNKDMKIVQKNPGYHGVGGAVEITTPPMLPLFRILEKTYNELGFLNTDVNGPNQTGTMLLQEYRDERGFRVSSASAFIDPNPHPNNLHIVTRALVTRILFNGTTAIGVEFARNDTPYRVYARKEVVLCAGVYNSPQLLMLSGIGIRSHLQRFGIPVIRELPVGNNFISHSAVHMYTPVINSSFMIAPTQLSTEQFSERYFNKTGSLGNFSEFIIYFATKSQTDKSYPNMMCLAIFMEDGRTLIHNCEFYLPRSRGTVRLQSASPYVPPRIDPNYLADPLDYQDMLEVTSFLFFIVENTTFASYVQATSLESVGCQSCPGQPNYKCIEGLECYLRQSFTSAYHPGGTCRMGDVRRDDVVVDLLLRVKNISKLRICDASIFPVNPNANTNAAVTMIGEKCAQIIKDCYHLN